MIGSEADFARHRLRASSQADCEDRAVLRIALSAIILPGAKFSFPLNFRNLVFVSSSKEKKQEGRTSMAEYKKRLLIAGSCLLLGSVEVLFQVFGLVSTR